MHNNAIYHFSQAAKGQGDKEISSLLRSVADQIDTGKYQDIRSLTLQDAKNPDEKPSVTVYYKAPGQNGEDEHYDMKLESVSSTDGFKKLLQDTLATQDWGKVKVYDVSFESEINIENSQQTLKIYYDHS